MIRKVPLVTGEYYHVFNMSIGGIALFRSSKDYEKFFSLIKYYRFSAAKVSYSDMRVLKKFDKKMDRKWAKLVLGNDETRVDISAYCLMPTHIHFLFKQKMKDGIKNFMQRIQNSYACCFNRKYKRRGALWAERFGGNLIRDDSHYLHITRYIHLNPTTAGLVDNPEDWEYSSYRQYIGTISKEDDIIRNECEITPKKYRDYVMERKDYQKEIGRIKSLMEDDEM